jgi:tRNA pseudouridine38-40 synthase
MPRFKLIIQYDGTPYAGWQAQTNCRTVQDAVEDAIFNMTGERVRLVAAGRTDAGVHALHQVAHADLTRHWRPDRLRDGLNAHLRLLDERVAVEAAAAMPDTFSARLSAKRRHYLYRIVNRRPPSPLEFDRAWHVPRALDHERMQQGAERLIGHHDFTTFRAAECQQKSPVKTLERLEVTRTGDIIEIRASARSFLHHQVRSMVGTLELAGAGRWTADEVEAALHARDRQRCGPMAPAGGLYFVGVDYDDVEPQPDLT